MVADSFRSMWGLSEDAWLGILGALALVVVGVIQAPRYFRNERTEILKELEILNALPTDSTSRDTLRKHIDSQIEALGGIGEKRRNPSGILMGAVFLAISAFFTWQLLTADNGWWWVTSPLLLLSWLIGIVGTVQGVQKHHRTPTGGIIDPSKQTTPTPQGGTSSSGPAPTAG